MPFLDHSFVYVDITKIHHLPKKEVREALKRLNNLILDTYRVRALGIGSLGMSYLAQGGPSAVELQALFRSLAQTGQIIAVSMTTWNPRLDRDGQSQSVSMALLRALIDQ